MAKKRLNWVEVRTEYIQDRTSSYRSLAEKYGVAQNTILAHAKPEGWIKARREVSAEANSKVQTQLADELVKVNDTHRRLYSNWQSLQAKMMNEFHQEVDDLIRVARANGTYVKAKQFQSNQGLMFFANGLKTGVDGERVTLGLPTTVTKSENEHRMVEDFSKMSDEQLLAILNTDASTSDNRAPTG